MRLSALALLFALPALRADEGMWTFDNVPVKAIQAKYGVDLGPAWLKNLQLATLRFPNGTGAFVSRDGLVITNHHVGRDAIAQVSTAAADLVRNGFTAATRPQEVKVPGLELMMLVSSEDVTARVNGAVKPGTADKDALTARRNALADLRKVEEAKTGLTCEPVTLYQGGEYWLYRYRKFKDVRLVAAPEVQVASFGGDPDNYTYPRWNLDFALFRVYEDGKPYRPEAFLPFAQTPLKAGDLTIISGHPGVTYRGQTLAQMRYAKEVGIPFQLAFLARQRRALEAYAKTSTEAARTSADAVYSISNGQKRLSGQLMGLAKPESLALVATREEELRATVAREAGLQASAGGSWDRIAEAVERQKALLKEYTCLGTRGSVLFGHALTLVRILEEEARPTAQRLPEFSEGSLKATRERLLSPRPVRMGLDEARLAWVLREAQEQLGEGHPFVKAILGGRTPGAVAKAACAGTRLQDPAFRKQLLEGGREALASHPDPMLALARVLDPFQRGVQRQWEDQVQSVFAEHGGRIARARFQALGKSQYPDATFTLRLSWGPVATYDTGSGTKAQPFTTFLGLYDRHAGWGGNAAAAEDGAFTLPERWLQAKGRLALETPFNFAYGCDTVGGNSGSPVVNAKGEFVGINFDSVLEGQGGYYVYDAATKRAVATDVRAILEALRKIMDAGHLADEALGK
ncbi:MAG: S46 family peptidase [Geothrix sp.]|uniref:S46 family peptidase n=1 Tax=Geothrix sp. TaxID=1962974 RepID=UPI0018599FD6|nr:S46 family peptidase [Geothrix sp.]NWJ42225.1 S46 family peptidase [Geothrix sp.]WIL19812.1 MAG: S46 family peptidase [Geothrix sp.]